MSDDIVEQNRRSTDVVDKIKQKWTKRINLKIHETLDKVQKISFLLLVSILIGIFIGIFTCYKIYKMEAHKWALSERIIIEDDVYVLTKRDVMVVKPEQKTEITIPKKK
jgi:hypothetical protein